MPASKVARGAKAAASPTKTGTAAAKKGGKVEKSAKGEKGAAARKSAPQAAALPAAGTPASKVRNGLAVRIGIGGWTFEPWRDNFYPAGLPHAQELAYASRKLSAIEVNGTYYSTFKPATFRKWHDETPDGFMFSLKANRFATNRRELAAAGDSVRRFIDSGIGELGAKLGPIVWQFMPTKVFDPEDFAAFLDLLPKKEGSLALRHVMDVRHPSFMSAEYLALARSHGVGTVFTDSDKFPSFADLSADFVYARLMKSDAAEPLGYAPEALDTWAAHARSWAAGGSPAALPRVEPAPAKSAPREVFVFFINGAKERAPAAAGALIERLA